ncbi:MAG: ribbon-helix-helix domain-containing protein [Sphingomonadaceae bacterium]
MAERRKFLLRISPELWEELNRWAAQEFRSVNGQIEYLLQRAVEERRRKGRSREPVQDPERSAPDASD